MPCSLAHELHGAAIRGDDDQHAVLDLPCVHALLAGILPLRHLKMKLAAIEAEHSRFDLHAVDERPVLAAAEFKDEHPVLRLGGPRSFKRRSCPHRLALSPYAGLLRNSRGGHLLPHQDGTVGEAQDVSLDGKINIHHMPVLHLHVQVAALHRIAAGKLLIIEADAAYPISYLIKP